MNEAEVSVLRRIFSEYIAGNSPHKIAALLNADQISSPRGGQWNASTINGNQKRRDGILNNELYLGRITYNRQRFVKDPDRGKRRSRPNPETLWFITHVPGNKKPPSKWIAVLVGSSWLRGQDLNLRPSVCETDENLEKSQINTLRHTYWRTSVYQQD